MDRLDRFFGVHGNALALRSERMSLIASNIANAATPNYKARDLDFASLIGTNAQHQPALATSSRLHFAATQSPEGEKRLRYRVPVQPSLDGNTVELATEQLQFTETALRYRSTLSALNGRITSIISALKGE